MYKYLYFNKKFLTYEGSEYATYFLESEYVNVNEASIFLGWEPIVDNRFLFDLYFGVGIRLNNGQTTDCASRDRSGLDYTYKPPVKIVFTELMPSLHLGIKVGFGWGYK